MDMIVVEDLYSSPEKAMFTNGHTAVGTDHAIAVHVCALTDRNGGIVEDLYVATVCKLTVSTDDQPTMLKQFQGTIRTDALQIVDCVASPMAQTAYGYPYDVI
jgi:hypothetical protein